MSQMDIAGGVYAVKPGRAAASPRWPSRAWCFTRRFHVGNVLCCYAEIKKIGNHPSITLRIEAWALPPGTGQRIKVTEGIFTYVALDADGKKRPVPPEA
jgi:acyl-CoA thioesterase YciA